MHEVLSEKEGRTLVKTTSGTYDIDSASFGAIESHLTNENVDDILSTMSSANAKTAKVFDPEAAAKKEAAARKREAVESFNRAMTDHTWSDYVNVLASDFQTAKVALAEAREVPAPTINLANLELRDGILITDVNSYQYKTVHRGGHKFTVIEILPLDFPVLDAEENEREAKSAFRQGAHSEAMTFASSVLGADLKVTNFALDDDGNIIYDATIKSPGGNGGTKERNTWRDAETGDLFSSKTAAGQALCPGNDYPWKAVQSLIDSGRLVKVEVETDK